MPYKMTLAEQRLLFRYINHTDTLQEGEHGLSSSPDTTLTFQGSSQLRWQSFSEQVIRDMCNMLRTGKKFYEIYDYGTKQRSKIALELQHGLSSTVNRTDEYGLYRPERYEVHERFFRGASKSPWKHQTGAVLRLIQKLVETDSKERVDFILEEGPNRYYEISVESPVKKQNVNGKSHTEELATIGVDFDFTHAVIIYPPYIKYNWMGDMELAEKYLEECRRWSYSGRFRTENLLESIGRLSHLLAHILPVKLGNAGIMGWIQRAIALYKGVQLGDYSQRTCRFTESDPHNDTIISWDFMALVTPDREEYAKWFAKYAFIDYCL